MTGCPSAADHLLRRGGKATPAYPRARASPAGIVRVRERFGARLWALPHKYVGRQLSGQQGLQETLLVLYSM